MLFLFCTENIRLAIIGRPIIGRPIIGGSYYWQLFPDPASVFKLNIMCLLQHNLSDYWLVQLLADILRPPYPADNRTMY